MLFVLLVAKLIQILFLCPCFWYFYISNWLKCPFIFMVLGTFTDQIDSNHIFIFINLTTFNYPSISTPFHIHCSYYFIWTSWLIIIISLSVLSVLLVVKSIQISFHCHCSWYFYWSNLFQSRFISIVPATFNDQSVSVRFHFRCSWYFNWSN